WSRPQPSPAATPGARSRGSVAIDRRCGSRPGTPPGSSEPWPRSASRPGDRRRRYHRLVEMPLEVTKGHGTGNDFVLFADPDGRVELSPERVARLADRNFGVGADGIIRAVRSDRLPEGRAALAEDPAAEWFMDYHNADGSPA